jgi:hypothetical protein
VTPPLEGDAAQGLEVGFAVSGAGGETTIPAELQEDGTFSADWMPEETGDYEVAAVASSPLAEQPGRSTSSAVKVADPGPPWTLIFFAIAAAILAAILALKAYSMFVVKEFPRRASLTEGGNEPRFLRRLGGKPIVPGFRMRSQKYTVGTDAFLDLGEPVLRFEATGRGVLLRSFNDTVTVNGAPLTSDDGPETVRGSAQLSGTTPSRWDIQYSP